MVHVRIHGVDGVVERFENGLVAACLRFPT
jgi:hypothetical protein